MKTVASIFVALVAVEHLWFMILEMFLWRSERGMKTFGTTKEFAEASAALAANQGLYNGFLVAGLVWSLLSANGYELKIFFLGCVVVAGLYGAATVKPQIAAVQALPAAIALALVLMSG